MVIHVEENDTRYFMQFPTPREQVLMRLASVWAEHWLCLEQDPCAWPEQLLEKVWLDLTMEYCLTAFEPPCTPEEALRQCIDEVKHVYFAYEEAVTSLQEMLWEQGALTGTEVTALLATWTVPDYDPAAGG